MDGERERESRKREEGKKRENSNEGDRWDVVKERWRRREKKVG